MKKNTISPFFPLLSNPETKGSQIKPEKTTNNLKSQAIPTVAVACTRGERFSPKTKYSGIRNSAFLTIYRLVPLSDYRIPSGVRERSIDL
jgi:hypothetical protein